MESIKPFVVSLRLAIWCRLIRFNMCECWYINPNLTYVLGFWNVFCEWCGNVMPWKLELDIQWWRSDFFMIILSRSEKMSWGTAVFDARNSQKCFPPWNQHTIFNGSFSGILYNYRNSHFLNLLQVFVWPWLLIERVTYATFA